jgi:plastocyanin
VRDHRSRSADVIRTAVLAVVAVALAACSSSAGAGWTFAPEPSVTPAPSASGSAAPSATAAPSASGSTAPSGSASAAPSGSGTAITVKAANIAFDVSALTAPAGQPFTINFDNQDAGIPHNIEILNANGGSVFKGDLVTGVATATYNVTPLAAGAYKFMCDVHPTMTGTLTVQ